MSKPLEISSLETVLKKMKLYYSSGTITLKEDTPDATLTSVVVSGLTPDYLAIKADGSKIQFFNSGFGNKQCDYILLSEFEHDKVAVFVELKSSVHEESVVAETPQRDEKGEYEDYYTQLKSSSCLLDYLHSILKSFCNCDILGGEYKRFFVVLHGNIIPVISEDIPLTRPVSNNTPEYAYVRMTSNNEKLNLRQLIR